MKVMAVVSSETLFHYTSSLKIVKDILKSKGFWPKYCIEYGWDCYFAVPMCCFCDIPLSLINSHVEKYGHFGIGMSKKWGIDKGLSPVMYQVKTSFYGSILKNKYRNICKNGLLMHEKELAFMKVHEGVNYRKDETAGNGLKQMRGYKYYDEREWRFVPNMENCEDYVRPLAGISDDTSGLNEKTKDKMCKFEYGDIKYIMVDKQSNKISLMKYINKHLSCKDKNEKEALNSKIIVCDIIKNDI